MYNILYDSDIYGASGMRRQVGFIPTSYLHNNFNTEMQVISLNILNSFCGVAILLTTMLSYDKMFLLLKHNFPE